MISWYVESKLKLMVVGRAMNGWGSFKDIHDVDSAITDTFRLLEEKNVLADVTTRGGIHTEDGTYYYSKSKFWKLIKYVLEEYGEAKEFSWYCDNGEPEWNQKIVWSNLYKISPSLGGNPNEQFIKNNMQTYIDILMEEIEINQPDKILFITDWNCMNPFEDAPSFSEKLGLQNCNNNQFVVSTGYFDNRKIVICKRPDSKFRNTNTMIKEWAVEIKQAFDSIRSDYSEQ